MSTKYYTHQIDAKTKGKAKIVSNYDDDDDDDDDVMILDVNPNPNEVHEVITIEDEDVDDVPCRSSRKRKTMDSEPDPNPVAWTFECSICADTKPGDKSFDVLGCLHSYCYDCIETYVSTKLGSGTSRFGCPELNCSGTLDPEYCKEILSPETYIKWGKMLCESTLDKLSIQKFYCPFDDCSALMTYEGDRERVTRAECWSCHRLFCAECKATWHEGVSCGEYQSLTSDERESRDLELRRLAKEKGWDRCPNCKFYVEKIDGCSSVLCRNCGQGFSYGKGALAHNNYQTPTAVPELQHPPYVINYDPFFRLVNRRFG